MSNKAQIILDGKTYEFPIIEGSEGEKAIDIAKLREETGYITLDLGYKNTGATKSAITFLDGEEGILHYRGYPIEQLAEKASFLEVSYLLLFGDLPNKRQLEEFTGNIRYHSLVHEDMKRFFEFFPNNAHPMGILSAMVNSLSTFYPKSQDPHRPSKDIERTIFRLIAKMPTLAAISYKNNLGHPYMYPNNKLDYVDNFLHMMFGLPTEDYHVDPVVSDALNKLLILHADHEQNCSASTVRMVGSSQARALPHCGGPCMAVRTRRSSKCWRPSATTEATSRNGWTRPRTRTIPSASSVSGTGCTRTSIRVPRSSRSPAMRCCANWG
jgi:citrate synthase